MPSASDRPLLAVTMGDPAGIGPEVVVKALSVKDVREVADTVVYGDARVLDRALECAGLPSRVEIVERPEDARSLRDCEIVPLLPVSELTSDDHAWSTSSSASDRAQLDYIESAAKDVVAGMAAAIVTAPISKASIARAGSPFAGHTEMLAELCTPKGQTAPRPVMMIAGQRLKVVPATVHVALREVFALLDGPLLEHTVTVVHDSFCNDFSLQRPRIGVAGLNPHASEAGMFGSEEAEIMEPVLAELRGRGIDVSDPISPDVVFRRAVDGEFDVVIGMYHDQALIPVKILDFDRAVNVTLGLPIIRTSVDHGTAYDLAGQGVASAGSMIAALRLAAQMARAREGVA